MFKFDLTQQQLHTIAVGLGELPYKHSAPLLAELQKQFDAQQPKPEEPGTKAVVLEEPDVEKEILTVPRDKRSAKLSVS